MKTMMQAMSDYFEICSEDTKLTVKEIVLGEASGAKCVKNKNSYSVKIGSKVYGKGITSDQAWENAALYIFVNGKISENLRTLRT